MWFAALLGIIESIIIQKNFGFKLPVHCICYSNTCQSLSKNTKINDENNCGLVDWEALYFKLNIWPSIVQQF